jgi:hypothetical protein
MHSGFLEDVCLTTHPIVTVALNFSLWCLVQRQGWKHAADNADDSKKAAAKDIHR